MRSWFYICNNSSLRLSFFQLIKHSYFTPSPPTHHFSVNLIAAVRVLLWINIMTDIDKVDNFDYLLKIVVIGGRYIPMQILESARPTSYHALQPTISHRSPSPPSEYNSPPKPCRSTPRTSKRRSGTLPGRKDLEQSLMLTTKGRRGPCLYLISPGGTHTKTFRSGSRNWNKMRKRILYAF